jgi:hypothetical protein
VRGSTALALSECPEDPATRLGHFIPHPGMNIPRMTASAGWVWYAPARHALCPAAPPGVTLAVCAW